MRRTWTRCLGVSGLLVLAGLCVGGCEAPQAPAAPGARADTLPPSAYPRITVEPGLNPWVFVVYEGILQEGGPPAGNAPPRLPMSVQVPIRSAAQEQITAQYRYQWFADNGRLLNEGGWKFVPLEPGVQTLLSGSAMDLEATGWRLEIRSAR